MPSAPLRLRCEFVNNPLGVSAVKPRLSWWIDDPRPAELQTAFEILASSSLALLDADEADLWRSGRVESNLSAHIEYCGKRLLSKQRVWWKVRSFDSDGLGSPWSSVAFFEMGLLEPADWYGDWIAAPLYGSRSRGVQAVALRRDFLLDEDVLSARLYVAALGAYRVEINGRAVPGDEATATWSDYDHEVYYQSFDVTALLLREPNAIGVLLGDGYFCGEIAGLGRGHYGDRPQIKLQMDITLASGRQIALGSDDQWHWLPGWVLAADINGGEHVDARRFVPGWSEAGLEERHWATVDVLTEPVLAMRSQPYPAFEVQQVLRPLTMPRRLRQTGRATSIYDFGDQLMGRVRVDLQSRSPDELIFSYGLDERFLDATTDTYTSAASADGERFASRFAVHSFRYLRVEYTPGITELNQVLARRIGLPDRASISVRCDHPTLNQLFEAIDNSLQTVSMSVPLAGVAAHEQLPDVAYASTWMPFAARHGRAHALVAKWLDDAIHAAELDQASSYVPALERAIDISPGDEVARFETIVGAAWALYRYQGDAVVLQRCYAQIRVAALSYRHMHPDLLRLEVAEHLYGPASMSVLVATCTAYGALRTASRIAGLLSHVGDCELIDALAEEVRGAVRRRFLSQDGRLAVDTQSAYVAVLYHKLLEDDERVAAEARLVELLQRDSYHADVVPAMLHALLPVLTQAGRLDMSYMTLLQTSAPSWLATVLAGGQHVGREVVRSGTGDAMFGVPDVANIGLMEWLLDALVGMAVHEDLSPDHNGYRAIRVRPMPPLGSQFLAGSPVQFVEASLSTIHGRYELKWWIREDCYELELVIPPGCSALVTMPDDIEQGVQSGFHRFVMDFGAGGDGVPTLLDMASGQN